jgi:gliding motility-associated-like protein
LKDLLFIVYQMFMKTGRLKQSVHCTLFILLSKLCFAQGSCPPNLDFESGSLQHWECFTGGVVLSAGQNTMSLSPSSPVANRHTVFGPSSAGVLDAYGQFPVVCPNGSGYSLKLGNNGTQRQAERISYTFTIPSGQNEYSVVYQYAVVFQNPNHTAQEQPKFTARVYDVAAGSYISCASFEFVATSNIPGFAQSAVNSNVWYKPWTAVTINLSGYSGKTVRLEFTTADCTQGAHFGYAYVDVNTGCNALVSGTDFCAGTGALSLQAPFGFKEYIWYNQSMTQQLGTGASLVLSPAPSSVTTYALDVKPYAGMGCRDTIYTTVTPAAEPPANAGDDRVLCNGQSATIGSAAVAGYAYSWSPATGLNDPNIASPVAAPGVTTEYILTVTDLVRGCSKQDKVMVSVRTAAGVDITASAAAICEGSTVRLTATGGSGFQWFHNAEAIPGATAASISVDQPGKYAVQLIENGCSAFADKTVDLPVVKRPAADFSFDKYCLGYPTRFTNTSSTHNNPVSYTWTINGKTSSEVNPVVSFTDAKEYDIQLTVTPQACPDLAAVIIKKIRPESPVAGISYLPKNAVANQALRLEARSLGSSYEWFPASHLSNNRSATPTYTGSTEQHFIIRILRPSGCVTVDTQLVRIFKEREVYVPKAFTPNNDGQNDRMYPFLVGIRELRVFRIMNRWGVIVYEAKTDLPGWDGSYRGAAQPMDGYVWEALAIDVDGNTITRKGSFTLIR